MTEAAKNAIDKANAGDAIWQNKLGVWYDGGEEGLEQCHAKAMEWYRKAADQGDAEAQSNIGVLYLFGQGVPVDYPLAAAWLLKAALQDNADAQFNLGLLYVKGVLGFLDSDELCARIAMYWIKKAATLGCPEAIEYAKKF